MGGWGGEGLHESCNIDENCEAKGNDFTYSECTDKSKKAIKNLKKSMFINETNTVKCDSDGVFFEFKRFGSYNFNGFTNIEKDGNIINSIEKIFSELINSQASLGIKNIEKSLEGTNAKQNIWKVGENLSAELGKDVVQGDTVGIIFHNNYLEYYVIEKRTGKTFSFNPY